ncbi:MAG: CinA family protein [Caldilineaceae bacterium]|nr:CinA family protein [Caldilineaceae bacterium]
MSKQMEVPRDEVALTGLAKETGLALKRAGLTAAIAESCTGGLVGHLMTEIPGSSDWFLGSAGVYSYAAKKRLLGVDHDLLLREGAVNAAVAGQMAAGALLRYEADVAVSITGVAGPGGTVEKPMGLVYLHLAAQDGTNKAEKAVWPADRRGNKLMSARCALEMLRSFAVDKANG